MRQPNEMSKLSTNISVLQNKLSLLRSELYRTKSEVDYTRVINDIESMELKIDELQRMYERKRSIERGGQS